VPDAEPASILDASALIAYLHDESGADAVVDAITAGAAVSVVNWAEALSKVAADGDDPQQVSDTLQTSASPLLLQPLTDADCVEIARLRPLTKAHGLSLADRACLALAKRLNIPVVTADREWADLGLGVSPPAHPLSTLDQRDAVNARHRLSKSAPQRCFRPVGFANSSAALGVRPAR
jgi:ribonuclease VapC